MRAQSAPNRASRRKPDRVTIAPNLSPTMQRSCCSAAGRLHRRGPAAAVHPVPGQDYRSVGGTPCTSRAWQPLPDGSSGSGPGGGGSPRQAHGADHVGDARRSIRASSSSRVIGVATRPIASTRSRSGSTWASAGQRHGGAGHRGRRADRLVSAAWGRCNLGRPRTCIGQEVSCRNRARERDGRGRRGGLAGSSRRRRWRAGGA